MRIIHPPHLFKRNLSLKSQILSQTIKLCLQELRVEHRTMKDPASSKPLTMTRIFLMTMNN